MMSSSNLKKRPWSQLGNQSTDSDSEKMEKWIECDYPRYTDKALLNINPTKKYKCMKNKDIRENEGLRTDTKEGLEDVHIDSLINPMDKLKEFVREENVDTNQFDFEDNSDFAGFENLIKERYQDHQKVLSCYLDEGLSNDSDSSLASYFDNIMQNSSSFEGKDVVITGDFKACGMKALVYLYNRGGYACIWHQRIAHEKDHDVRHLYYIRDKHVNLVKRVMKGLIRRFRNQEDESDLEFVQVCERIVGELKNIFGQALKILEEFVSYVDLEEDMNHYGQSENYNEDGSGSSAEAQDGYFDPETLLNLAGISQEAIGRISIIPDLISSEDDNDITIYPWQHKVRNTLAEVYPKIQSYCSRVVSTENFNLLNPFSLSLNNYISSKISQKQSKDQLSNSKNLSNTSEYLDMKVEEDSKIFALCCLEEYGVGQESGFRVRKAFSQSEDEGGHEFSCICEKAVEELENDFKWLWETGEDGISKPWFHFYYTYEGNIGKNYGDLVKSKKNILNRYFDPEKLLELALVTQGANGRVFILPNGKLLGNNNEIMPYSWQNKVKKTLCRWCPKIQKIYFQGKNSEYLSPINPFAKSLEDSITSKDPQKSSEESLDNLNSPKRSDKNPEEKNTGTKTCDHEGCSIPAFCYIPRLDCYFGIRHCISPGKDTYPKLYLYHEFEKEDLLPIKKSFEIIQKYVKYFKDFTKNKIIKIKYEQIESKNQKLYERVLTIFNDIFSKFDFFMQNAVRVFYDVKFQQLVNTSSNYSKRELNSKRKLNSKELLSWDQIHANFGLQDLPKLQNNKNYLNPKIIFELLSITREHVEDFLGNEGFSFFVKNIVRACIFEVFYMFQGHHENINFSLDSNFFIQLMNAIEDLKFQKDVSKYINLPETKLKLNTYFYDMNLIITKFIEYQNLSDSRYLRKKSQKIYDETSLSFHIPNILKIYNNFLLNKSQDGSKIYKYASQFNNDLKFYEMVKDRPLEYLCNGVVNKSFKGDYSEKCINIPFYFLPECDKNLGLLHRIDEAYSQYSKFEPLHRFLFAEIPDFVTRLQAEYFLGYYSGISYKDKDKREKEKDMKLLSQWYTFVMSEAISKGYSDGIELKNRIEGQNKDSKLIDAVRSLTDEERLTIISKLISTGEFDKIEDSYEFQDKVLKVQIVQEIEDSQLNISERDQNKEEKIRRVNEYLENNKIYDEKTDKIGKFNPFYPPDDSRDFLF